MAHQNVPQHQETPVPRSKGWKSRRLRFLLSRKTQRGASDQQLLSVYREYGVILKASRDDNFNRAGKDLDAYLLVTPGTLVINKMKAWQGSLGVSSFRGIVSPAYFTFEVHDEVYGRFLHFLLRSYPYAQEWAKLSAGIRPNQWDLNPSAFLDTPAVYPPLPTQRAIADFLDRKTAAIDDLIAKKERLIALLEEKRQALITRSVTKGLDPSVPMKDSGIPWLGEIPVHWEISRVKHLASIQRGRFSHRPRNDPALYGGPHPFIQTGDVA